MLRKTMIVSKTIDDKIERKFFFITGKINLDSNYFINKIKKSCTSEDNLNFRTNIKGNMTPYKFFNNDKYFLILLMQFIELIDEKYNFPKYHIKDAWGFEVSKDEKTLYHSHATSLWSGVFIIQKRSA